MELAIEIDDSTNMTQHCKQCKIATPSQIRYKEERLSSSSINFISHIPALPPISICRLNIKFHTLPVINTLISLTSDLHLLHHFPGTYLLGARTHPLWLIMANTRPEETTRALMEEVLLPTSSVLLPMQIYLEMCLKAVPKQ